MSATQKRRERRQALSAVRADRPHPVAIQRVHSLSFRDVVVGLGLIKPKADYTLRKV